MNPLYRPTSTPDAAVRVSTTPDTFGTAERAHTAMSETCNCEPIEYDDGSRTHADDCPMHPWCPHEVGAYTCAIPCGCPCGPCKVLEGGAK